MKNILKIWSFENYLKIEVLTIKFEKKWKFENYLKIKVWKIKFENYSKIRVLKITWKLEFFKN